MKRSAFVLSLAIMPAFAYAQETPLPVAVIDVPEAAFVQMAASSNAFEIRSSELAQEKATTDVLKDFGRHMITDHTKAGEDMRAAAGDIPVPTEMSPKHAAMIALLTEAEGTDFDLLYKDMQAAGHAEAVTLFTTFDASGQGTGLQTFAEATLPVLKEHKAHIDQIVAMP